MANEGAVVEFRSKNDFTVIRNLPSSSAPLYGGSFGLSLHVRQKIIDYYMKQLRFEEKNEGQLKKLRHVTQVEHEHLRLFQHPNIVRSIGWFEENNSFFSVLEFCGGGNLADYLENLTECLPEYQIQLWLFQLCSAVSFIHVQNFIHKNIQTKNVLLSINADSGSIPTVKLSGFDKIEQFSMNMKPAEILQRSPSYWPYAAPELWLFKPHTLNSDVWSIGVISYEMANRALPFPSRDPGLVAEILFNEPVPFSTVNWGYSEHLNGFILKLLEKDPNLRPPIDQIFEDPFFILNWLPPVEEAMVELLPEPVITMEAQEFGLQALPTPSPSLEIQEAVERTEKECEHEAPIDLADKIAESSIVGDADTLKTLLNKDKELTTSILKSIDSDHPLHMAARNGHLAICQFLIDEFEVPVDHQCYHGDEWRDTALFDAVENSHVDIVRYLVKEKNANVDLKSDGKTPFILACIAGNLEIIKILVADGLCNLEVLEPISQLPAIHLALNNHNLEIAEYLLNIRQEFLETRSGWNNIADVPFEDIALKPVELVIDAKHQSHTNQNRTPLLECCYNGNADGVDLLIKRGADVNAKLNWGNYLAAPIHVAALKSNINCIEVLLRHNPELLATTTLLNDTCLNLAAQRGLFSVAEYLIRKHEVNIENRGSLNRSPLLQAAASGNLKIVKLLLSKGADIYSNDNNSIFKSSDSAGVLHSNILHVTADGGHVHVIDHLLIVQPSLIDSKDSLGNTALNRACTLGIVKVVKFLLSGKRKANVENRGLHFRTPVMAAVANGHLEIVDFLVNRRNADICLADKDNNTCLHLAVIYNHIGIAEVLIEFLRRTDPNKLSSMFSHRNAFGQTAMATAKVLKRKYFVDFLYSCGSLF